MSKHALKTYTARVVTLTAHDHITSLAGHGASTRVLSTGLEQQPTRQGEARLLCILLTACIVFPREDSPNDATRTLGRFVRHKNLHPLARALLLCSILTVNARKCAPGDGSARQCARHSPVHACVHAVRVCVSISTHSGIAARKCRSGEQHDQQVIRVILCRKRRTF
jgi:hypothetical protein